jgi:uncharacterized protein
VSVFSLRPRRAWRGLLALTTLSALLAGAAIAAPSVRLKLPPAPPRFLYDQPGLLAADERAAIEDSLMAYDRAGVEIGVAIFNSLEGDAIEDVAMALAETWRPGNAERDNGALVVIGLEEHAMRIEIGYGLEGRIPDGVAGRIIRYDMTPAFREGRFGDGIAKAISNIARAARGEAIPEPKQVTIPEWLPIVFIIFMIMMMNIARRASRRSRTLSRRHGGWWWPGGFGGLGGGGWRGGGGGWSGGGGGSFGGGSFGGGGASGRW